MYYFTDMKKRIIVLAVSVVILAALIPLAVRGVKDAEAERKITKEYEAYVASHDTFFDQTFVNGTDIGGMSVDEAVAAVLKDFKANGSIVVSSPYSSVKDTLSFKGFSVQSDGLRKLISECYDARTLSRGEYIHGAAAKNYSYNFSDDIDYSKSDFLGLTLFDEKKQTESRNAYVSVDENKNTIIVKEVVGTCVERSSFEKKLADAIKRGLSELVLDYDDFIKPEILSTDEHLAEEQKYVEILLTKSVLLNVCGVELLLTPDDTYKLYDFDSDDRINEDVLSEYVDELGKKYDTYGTYRPFVTSTGASVYIQGGDYGWRINKSETVEAIKEALLSDTQNEAAMAVYDIVGQRPADSEIGNTYVEISLENQKIWMYLNGELIACDDCTTGEATDPNCTSDAGMFRLVVKKRDVVLRGPTWEDFVSFWMNFDGNNGMHDASWRTDEEFGGTNRYGNGSHGCTNLRYNTASIVFENIQYDTPIIVW